MADTVTKEQVFAYWENMRDAMFKQKLIGTCGPSLLWFFSMNGYTKFFFTQGKLAKMFSVSRQAINHAVNTLEEEKCIRVKRPPQGSHKPLEIELVEVYRAPAKFIFGLHDTSSSCQDSLHVMSAKLTRGQNKNVPVMSAKLTHNGVNGIKVNGIPKNNPPTLTGIKSLSTAAAILPHIYPNLSEAEIDQARSDVEKEGKKFDDETFKKIVRNFNDYCTDKGKKETQAYLRIFLRNSKETNSNNSKIVFG